MRSLRSRARRAGVIYAVMSVVGAPALVLLPRFVVPDDAAATAHRIAAGAQLYRLIALGDLAGSILFAVLGWSLYHLFEEVDRKQALLMLLLVVVSATVGVIDAALLWSPIAFQLRAAAFAAFTPAQLDALALAVLKIRGAELRANEALWGLWLVPFGLLVIRSGFIPKLIGVLLFLASVGYVVMSATFIAFPAQSPAVDRVGMLLIQGELAAILWLLIVGARGEARPRPAAPLTEPTARELSTTG